MNFGIVSKVLGILLLLEAALMSFPLLVSFIYGEHDTVAFLITIAVTGLTGFIMWRMPIRKKTIKIKEGLAIVSLGWLLISVFGAIPFILSGSIESFVDALFETISGFTTTGATIIDDVEILPHGILFWRSFTHWIGGMGILVFTIALLPALGVGSFQIFKAESPGPITDKIVPRIKDTAKILYIIYGCITILEILLLCLGGMSLFESAVYTFGSVGTGGFSTKNISLAYYDNTYFNVVISVFMILSGVNFSLYYSVYKGKVRELINNQELRLYLGIIGASVILIAIDIYANVYGSLGKSLEHSLFQVSSIITTTGYASADFDLWPTFSKMILFMLMFVGGCAGSTTGSIKNIRILVLIKIVKREFKKIFHPRAVMPVKIGQRTLSEDTLSNIAGFFVLYMLVFAAGVLLISLEGKDIVTTITAVAATLGNIGPGLGKVGPAYTFSHFNDFSTVVMSLLMLLGRLELFTMLALLTPRFWKREV